MKSKVNKETRIRNTNKKQPFFNRQIKEFNSRMVTRIKTPHSYFSKNNIPNDEENGRNNIAEKTAFHRFIYFILLSKLYRNGIINDAIFKKKYKDILNFKIFERHKQHPETFAVFFSQMFVMYFMTFAKRNQIFIFGVFEQLQSLMNEDVVHNKITQSISKNSQSDEESVIKTGFAPK